MTGGLVVNADDLGVTKGATLGIMKAHREGIVTSASLSVTTPFYEHAVESCVRTCPDLGIGLHFTLTSGRPLSNARDVPQLVDARGFFRWRFVPLLAAVSVQQKPGLLDQIAIELEAQVRRLLDDGIRPDHIDGERHVQLIPGIFDKVVEAARRHGVPFVRAGREIGGRFVRSGRSLGPPLRGGFAKSWLLSALSAKGRTRLGDTVRTPDHVASYLYSGRMDLILTTLLAGPSEPGVTEVMVHPGIPEESGTVELGNSELERYVALEDRREELDACIKARGSTGTWTLTNFTRLVPEMRSR